jgi:hypothetical protein
LIRAGEEHDALEDAWLAMMIFLWRQKVPIHDGRFVLRRHPPTNLKATPGKEDRKDEFDDGVPVGLLRGREPGLRAARGKVPSGPPRDIDEEDDSEEAIDLDDLTVGITYEDVAGNGSERVVQFAVARRNADTVYVAGLCQLRGAWRTFRLDRIRAVTDYRTGEVIEDVAGFFSSYLPKDWIVRSLTRSGLPSAGPKNSSASLPNSALKTFADGAKVLLYVALEDGDLHEHEYQLILEYALGRVVQSGYRDLVLADQVAHWIRNHVPSSRSAKLSLGRLMRDPVLGAEVADLIVRIVSADGHISEAEIKSAYALVETMRKREATGASAPGSELN